MNNLNWWLIQKVSRWHWRLRDWGIIRWITKLLIRLACYQYYYGFVCAWVFLSASHTTSTTSYRPANKRSYDERKNSICANLDVHCLVSDWVFRRRTIPISNAFSVFVYCCIYFGSSRVFGISGVWEIDNNESRLKRTIFGVARYRTHVDGDLFSLELLESFISKRVSPHEIIWTTTKPTS